MFRTRDSAETLVDRASYPIHQTSSLFCNHVLEFGMAAAHPKLDTALHGPDDVGVSRVFARDPAPCDFCGVPRLVWRKCKLICEACGNINKSCADL